VVQPWLVDLVIVGPMVLENSLGLRVTTYSSTMFISILFDKWNTLAKMGWASYNNMASCT
jgi:hypothetical protein